VLVWIVLPWRRWSNLLLTWSFRLTKSNWVPLLLRRLVWPWPWSFLLCITESIRLWSCVTYILVPHIWTMAEISVIFVLLCKSLLLWYWAPRTLRLGNRIVLSWPNLLFRLLTSFLWFGKWIRWGFFLSFGAIRIGPWVSVSFPLFQWYISLWFAEIDCFLWTLINRIILSSSRCSTSFIVKSLRLA